ncbi:MerR family transcriptional regulator [Lysinibacillus sp. NPDC059133]|uniref:MerR family transcriptional regulator n=1 Tax=Lysinibacillus sp. NPDC059133 TaxID=3346737 RepID=UPI00369B5B57
MYKIGEFSRMNNISQRMLRYYDEKALLKPKKDETNGYRYYTNEDIAIANKIKLLRKYHFSIDEIKNVLNMDSVTIKDKYEQKIGELYDKTIEYYQLIEEMKTYIVPKNTTKRVNTYDVFCGVKKPFHALCLREVVDENGLELLIQQLILSVNQLNPILNGKHFAIFHSKEVRDDSRYDVEVCQPIIVEEEVKDTRIKFFEETNYIYTIHIGNYDNINYAYNALYDWAHSNGYRLEGPFIEKYYTDEFITLDRDKYVTEVGIAIKKC